MADWKQITARIRRARSGKDPAAQLTNLFSKTRDAMVAFELARYFESKGNGADAGRWYLTAAERFRRVDWKTKAQESAIRLGATEPAEIPAPAARNPEIPTPAQQGTATEEASQDASDSTSSSPEPETVSTRSSEPPAAPAADSNRQRRGRRGARDQRPPRRGSQSGTPRDRREQPSPAPPRAAREESTARTPVPKPVDPSPAPDVTLPSNLRGRFGDPGLSSRLTQLEMNFRRLLACPPCALEDAEKAPAGPGVWVLTDSDMSSYYYVEPCQTLRVAIPHLLRGTSARRGESIKPRLAEHLGIPENRVAKYLSEHCVVRWLQMDEDASHFAHFLIAVLRPNLNE